MGTSKSLLSLVFFIVFSPSIFGNQEKGILSIEKVSEAFEKWMEMNGKVYADAEEESVRRENFRKSLEYVLEKNSNRRSKWEHTVGLNKFADLSNEEFKRMYLSKVKGSDRNKSKMRGVGINMNTTTAACEAPASVDWRDKGVVTPIKDQGQCGSCWAFSVTGSIESAHAIATGELISLSEQELVDCDTYDYGCEGGNMDTAFAWIIKNGGIDTEADYPYTSTNGYDGKCIVSKENRIAVSIDSYTDVEPNESALLCAVAKQPVAVGIDGSAYDFQLYTGGIYEGECSSSPNSIDHAALVVGYGSQDGEDYWIVKNSWGTYWGMDGYIFMKRNTNVKNGVCGINLEPSYPHSSTPPPPGPPPPPAPPAPPSPAPPPPSECGDYSYCAADQTCCCVFEFYDYCLIYGCCGYTNASCCRGTSYCCPSDYPVCDVYDGYCFKNAGDKVGVAAKKRKMAKHKMPWENLQPLMWKTNKFAAVV